MVLTGTLLLDRSMPSMGVDTPALFNDKKYFGYFLYSSRVNVLKKKNAVFILAVVLH